MNLVYAENAIVEQEEKARFEISKLLVEGNTLVATQELEQSLQPFIIKDGSIDTLQSALLAIEAVYAKHGFSAMKAVLPEQEADAGVFRIQVIEAKLSKVKVTGNSYFSEENIRNSAPDLVIGESPNLLKVAKSLRVANENFAKYTRVVISKAQGTGEVEAELKVQDGKPYRFAVSLDNTGTKPTGRQRLGFVFQHANLFDRDHAMAAQFTTSPEHEDQVKIFGLSYRIPIYSTADTIDISAGHSDVSSGNVTTTAGVFGISGSGDFASVTYNHQLPLWRDIEQKISLGLNWRYYGSNVTFNDQDVGIPDLTSAPAVLTYTMGQTQNERKWQASLSAVYNLSSGDKGDKEAYNQPLARPGADSHFKQLRYQFAYASPISSLWNVSAELSGQHTDDMLISGEKYGVGGAGSVRGFDMREVNGDKGFRGSVEFTTMPREINKSARIVGALFTDYGYAELNNPAPGETKSEVISSIGGGFRMGISNRFQMRLDLARVLNGSPTYDSGRFFGHFDMIYLF